MDHRDLPNAAVRRAHLLSALGLYFAGDPATREAGNRDLCIVLGSGSGDRYQPWLRIATGSPLLAHAVARGELELAICNPSALLTQAYRGTGLFAVPLPVRVVASYPSWDRFACVVHPRTQLTALSQVRERRYPLRLSIRQDPTHATRVLVDQLFAAYGFSLADLEAWGGSLQLCGPPSDPRRFAALAAGELDAVLDEGVRSWLDVALAHGMQPLDLDEAALRHLEAIGWRRAIIPAARIPGLERDCLGLDFGGWPLYTRAALPDDDAYRVCAALQAQVDEIIWEPDSFAGIDQLGQDTESTPLEVPLHPGAARWYRERGFPAYETNRPL